MHDLLRLFAHNVPVPDTPAHTPLAAAPAAPQGTGHPHPDSHFGRLSNAVSRSGARFRSNKVDVSTAVYQRSTLGKPFAPEDYVSGGKRYEPGSTPPSVSAAVATPLRRTEKHGLEALSRFSRSAVAQAAAIGHGGAEAIPFTDRSSAATAMNSEADLRAHLSRILPAPSDNLLTRAELAHRLVALGAPDGSPPTTRGAVLAAAMKHAKISDAHEALEALDHLAQLDFTALDRARSTSTREGHAWLIARALSRSDAGFDALEHLRRNTRPPTEDPTIRTAQRMILETADALEPDVADTPGPRPDPAPGAVAARHAPPPGANLADTPFAWRAHASASTFMTHGREAMTPDQKGTFFAWRQNFRDDGRGSELSRAQGRLNKFSAKTVANVTAPRWRTFFPRLVGKQKSPLSALQLGLQGIPRKQVGAEVTAMQGAMREALPHLLERPEMQPQAALAHARPEKSIVELAALCVWLESGGFPNGTIDAAHTRLISERANALCTGVAPRERPSPVVFQQVCSQTAQWARTDPAVLVRNEPFKSMTGRPFNAERLALWGKVAKVPVGSPFWTHVATVKNAARPETEKPATDSPDAARNVLKDVAGNLQGGSRLRLTDGSRIGISTRGLSANVGTLLHLHGIPLGPRIDLRASRTREAVVELSMSTHGTEMFLGTAKTSQRHAAVGVLVGYDIDFGLTRMRAGLTTQAVLHSEELINPSGVTFRVARRVKEDGSGYDDAAMRTKLAGLVDHVFDDATHASQGGGHATWNRLAERCFDDPDVSVSWTDSISREVRRGGSTDVSATFQPNRAITEMRLGPNVGVGYEAVTQQTLDSDERSGRIRVEQHRSGGGSRWLARLSGGLGASIPVGDGERSAGVGLVSIDAPSVTIPIADSTHLAKVQLVRENGVLNHRACLFDTEYASARFYTDSIDATREQWIDLFSRQTLEEQSAERDLAAQRGEPAPQQPEVRAVAEKRLDRHLGDVKANRRMNQRFFHRYRLKRNAAKQLDILTALRDLPASRKDSVPREALDSKMDQILGNAASWMPIELKVKERTAAKPGTGLNIALQMNTQTSSTGDRELFAESIPFVLLEQLDR
jgi:cellulose synthase operon protein C